MTQSANDLLMSGGIKSIKWKDQPVGYTVVGTIVDEPKATQMTKFESDELDFWPSGDPKMQIVVTIQTELRDPSDALDDGKRHLHIPPRMMPPVREAVKRAGAAGLAIGGKIAVQRTGGTGTTGSPFEFAAEYQQPAIDPGGLLAGAANGQPAAANAQPAAAAAPATIQGSLLTGPAAIADTPPPGVDPVQWASLGEHQKAAVRAAMAQPATSAPF